MHVVVANQKGGAGKSSLIRSLAVATHQAGHATALLDTDPQGSLTSWWTGARIRSRCSCGSSWPISRPGSNGWPRRASSFCSWTRRPRFAPSCGRSSVTPASQSFRSAPPRRSRRGGRHARADRGCWAPVPFRADAGEAQDSAPVAGRHGSREAWQARTGRDPRSDRLSHRSHHRPGRDGD